MERTPPPNLSATTSTTPRSARSTGSSSAATPTLFDDANHANLEELTIGSPVWVRRKGQPLMEGEVAYLGDVAFAEGPWVGVRLTGTSADLGKHNGTVEQVSYFHTEKPHAGVFVRITAISKRTVVHPTTTSSSNPSTPTATTAAPTAVNMFRTPIVNKQRNAATDSTEKSVKEATPKKTTRVVEEDTDTIDWDEQERRLVALEEWKIRKNQGKPSSDNSNLNSPAKSTSNDAVTPTSSSKKRGTPTKPTSNVKPASSTLAYSPPKAASVQKATKSLANGFAKNSPSKTAPSKDPPIANAAKSPPKSPVMKSTPQSTARTSQGTSQMDTTTKEQQNSKEEDTKSAGKTRRKVPPLPVSTDVLAQPPATEEPESVPASQNTSTEGNGTNRDLAVPLGEDDVEPAAVPRNNDSAPRPTGTNRHSYDKGESMFGFFQSIFVCLFTMAGWIAPGILGVTLIMKEDTPDHFVTEIAAGLVLGQIATSVLLFIPLLMSTLIGFVCCCTPTTSSTFIWNMARVSNALTFWMGLILLVTSLTSSMRREHGDTIGLEMMGSAAGTMMASALAVMISFWPATMKKSGPRVFSRHSYAVLQTVGGTTNDGDIQNDSLTEPLLAESERDLEAPANAEGGTVTEGDDSPNQDSEGGEGATGRLRGTRRLLQMASTQVLYLYLGCAALLIRLPFSLAIPHFVSTTLTALGHGNFHVARQEVLYLFVLGSIDAVLDFWCIFLFGYANERIIRGIRTDLFSKLIRMEISFFDTNNSGTLTSRLNSDCSEMAGDLTWFFRFSIESVVRIVGITTYMMIRSPHLGACALSIIPIVGVINKLYGDWLRDNAIAVQDSLAEANKVAQEALSNVRTVISFAAEDLEDSNYQEKIQSYYKLRVKQIFMTGVYYMTVSTFLINTVIQASLLYYGAYLIQHGHLTPSVLLAFMLYQGQLQQETQNLFNSFSSLIKSSGAGDKVFALLDRQPPPPATGSATVQETAVTSALDTEPLSYELSLQNVSFNYPTRLAQPVLKDIVLDFPKGSTVAMVGKSGCGKTTVVNLLQRYYDPTHGTVLLNGCDLRSYDLKHHRRRIGVVSQDCVLFDGSILDNITYGYHGRGPSASDETSTTLRDAERAAALAHADAFIRKLPQGYHTLVGENGVQLSGGQRQRISIARAMYQRPLLLILDEATSNLDHESEEIVQQALDDLLSHQRQQQQGSSVQTTTIVIAHRLNTVENADFIAVLDHGRVMEFGPPADLLRRRGGAYRRMVSKAKFSNQLIDE